MTRIWCAAVLLGLMTAVPPANAWDRGDVDVLTVLPDATPGQPSSVEGLTVGPDGNIYVPSFGFNTAGALSGNAALFVIKPDGQVGAQSHHRQFKSPHAGTALQSGQRIPARP